VSSSSQWTTVPAAFPAALIEAICRELGEAVIGSRITQLIAPLKVIETPQEEAGTKWKRLYNAVVRAQNRQRDGRPLLRIISETMQPVRFDSVAQFERHRERLNERLLLFGYRVLDDGKVARTEIAGTLAEAKQRANALHGELTRRNVHPDVLDFCREELLQQNYFHAVLEAAKSVADKIRNMTGLGLDGSRLADAAFSLGSDTPPIAFNTLSTEWERSEHTGLATLCKGLFGTFRNPTAHAPRVRWAVEQIEAMDMLTLASMLHRRLDGAQVRPSP